MAGLNKFPDKKRREQRRRNHIARDLQKRQFRQQRIEKRRKGYTDDGMGVGQEELE